jgi:hypothetical protein
VTGGEVDAAVIDQREEAFAIIVTLAEEHCEDHVPLFFGCR